MTPDPMIDSDKAIEFPRIYCINLKASTNRHQRMMKRFNHHGISIVAKMVEAIPQQSCLVDYYLNDLEQPNYSTNKWRGEVACFASHLKAIRQFVHDTPCDKTASWALICEDDILFHNDFLSRYIDVIKNAPSSTPLISMSYMLENNSGLKWEGVNPKKRNLISVNKHTWGAQLYFISRKYALEVLATYDRPFKEVNGSLLTSEVIIQESKGFLTYPPLAIEDGIDSDQDPEDLPYHRNHFKVWGYDNYNASESV